MDLIFTRNWGMREDGMFCQNRYFLDKTALPNERLSPELPFFFLI